MRHQLLRYLRKHRRELSGKPRSLPGHEQAGSSRPALSRLALEELRHKMLTAIGSLREPDRTVIIAVYTENRAVPEIADQLGKT